MRQICWKFNYKIFLHFREEVIFFSRCIILQSIKTQQFWILSFIKKRMQKIDVKFVCINIIKIRNIFTCVVSKHYGVDVTQTLVLKYLDFLMSLLEISPAMQTPCWRWRFCSWILVLQYPTAKNIARPASPIEVAINAQWSGPVTVCVLCTGLCMTSPESNFPEYIGIL